MWAGSVIGLAMLSDKPDALYCAGQLELQLTSAEEAYIRLKAGLLDGISIGYVTNDAVYQNGVRMIKDIDLWEVSLVTFPANDAARVTSVKTSSSDLARLAAILEEMHIALQADDLLAKMSELKMSMSETPDDVFRRFIRSMAELS